jgi:hypothetical protein
LLAQAARDVGGCLLIVLDQQDLHKSPPATA